MTPHSREICGVRVDVTGYDAALERTIAWAHRRESRVVCFSTVHMIMEAHDSPEYNAILRSADIVAPDGMPLVWALRLLRERGATRVYGPDFTRYAVAAAERERIPIALYGGTPASLQKLIRAFERRHPNLEIAYAFAPPFRRLTPDELEIQIAAIRDSGAGIVLVGLGCPKQEQWMAEGRCRIPAVMLGVGAAFDFLSGVKPQAPRWMMNIGLEWMFRLATEPRRLWLRYLRQNPRFVIHFVRQLLAGASRTSNTPDEIRLK